MWHTGCRSCCAIGCRGPWHGRPASAVASSASGRTARRAALPLKRIIPAQASSWPTRQSANIKCQRRWAGTPALAVRNQRGAVLTASVTALGAPGRTYVAASASIPRQAQVYTHPYRTPGRLLPAPGSATNLVLSMSLPKDNT